MAGSAAKPSGKKGRFFFCRRAYFTVFPELRVCFGGAFAQAA
jgi:hypothetical protein